MKYNKSKKHMPKPKMANGLHFICGSYIFVWSGLTILLPIGNYETLAESRVQTNRQLQDDGWIACTNQTGNYEKIDSPASKALTAHPYSRP